MKMKRQTLSLRPNSIIIVVFVPASSFITLIIIIINQQSAYLNLKNYLVYESSLRHQ